MLVGDKFDENPYFLGMGFAGSEVINDDNNRPNEIILPDNVERPKPQPKREFGFNAIKAGIVQGDNQREHQRART